MPVAILLLVALIGAAALLPALARRRMRGREPPSRFVRDRARDAEAERRARGLLRATAGERVHAMYCELGFVELSPAGEPSSGGAAEGPAYGYLIYPHRAIVAYDAASGELLSEYCVRFPDRSEPEAGEWLPAADDVLAKWLALRADEERLISTANMHLPGRQLDPEMVRRDLAAARAWAAPKVDGAPESAPLRR
jgi:hypothetical protein